MTTPPSSFSFSTSYPRCRTPGRGEGPWRHLELRPQRQQDPQPMRPHPARQLRTQAHGYDHSHGLAEIQSQRRPVRSSLAVTRGVGPEERTRLGYDRAPVSRANHARGPAQINPFGYSTGGHARDQIAAHNGGYARGRAKTEVALRDGLSVIGTGLPRLLVLLLGYLMFPEVDESWGNAAADQADAGRPAPGAADRS